MTIEEIRNYAKEMGIPEKRIEVLVAELHPDKNGELSTAEALDARIAIDYVARLRNDTRVIVERVRALRKQRDERK